MKQQRLRKIAEEIKRIVSTALMMEMKDPRLPAIVSITKVDVTADLKTATIYVSAIGSEAIDQEEMIQILNKAKGFFRKEIGRDLKVFNTPEPIFVYDDSIARGMQMDELLRKIAEDDEKKHQDE